MIGGLTMKPLATGWLIIAPAALRSTRGVIVAIAGAGKPTRMLNKLDFVFDY